MHLKSVKITNFRKFGSKNNTVEFVGAKDVSSKSHFTIAPSTTLIVGKNNSGKTTITKALNTLLSKETDFHANDFNFIYLNNLLDEYKQGEVKKTPAIEFEVAVSINLDSDCDLVTNIVPFINIENTQASEQERVFRVILKYEVKEKVIFENDIKSLIEKEHNDSALFRKFLELIESTDFRINYYDAEGVLLTDSKFRISDLIEITVINANKIIDDKSLSKTFNRIIKFRHKLETNPKVKNDVEDKIDKINETMTEQVSAPHTSYINNALGKIESRCTSFASIRVLS